MAILNKVMCTITMVISEEYNFCSKVSSHKIIKCHYYVATYMKYMLLYYVGKEDTKFLVVSA